MEEKLLPLWGLMGAMQLPAEPSIPWEQGPRLPLEKQIAAPYPAAECSAEALQGFGRLREVTEVLFAAEQTLP